MSAKQGKEEANPVKPESPPEEPVWTYRGYKLKTSEFVTAMVHFFRAEVSRANVWRQRLDATTNWAVISTGAVLSIAFSQPNVHHAIIILNIFLVSIFLYIESRRYRYYELWSYRVRLMETDFFAAMLVPPFHPSPEWAEGLADSLLSPRFPISIWEAIGRRLRRNYIWIFFILGMAWVAKYWLYPQPAMTLAEIVERAAIGSIPGTVVILFNLLYFLALILLAVLTAPLQQSSGEVLSNFGGFIVPEHKTYEYSDPKTRSWFNLRKRRSQFIALIITDNAEGVSKRLTTELNRGVTALHGEGMFTHRERDVLICAVTVTEINNLKKITAEADPTAFVMVMPAQEILGRGFFPLAE